MANSTLLDEADVQEYVNLPKNLFSNCGDKTIIFIADNGNHFTHYGIYEGMLLFFDTERPFKENHLSCFINEQNEEPKFKLSDTPIDGYRHLGRLIYSLKNYEVN